MKTFPDPLEKRRRATPELLAQFARQSRAAYNEMQGQDQTDKPEEKHRE